MTTRTSTIIFNFTAENQFSENLLMDFDRKLDLSLRGSFVANVSLQRSSDEGVTWQDVEIYTSPLEVQSHSLARPNLYRIGIKTGDYTSGSASGKLERI